MTHSSLGDVASARNRRTGSGIPWLCPWLTTGFVPTRIVSVVSSWSSAGESAALPPTRSNTYGRLGVSIVSDVYFAEPSARWSAPAMRPPAASKAVAVAR
jgi:hypothetical protein